MRCMSFEASGDVHRPRDSVLRELFNLIEVRCSCQHSIYRASLRLLPEACRRDGVSYASRLGGATEVLPFQGTDALYSAKLSKQRNDHIRSRSAKLLKNNELQWLGFGRRPEAFSTAVKRLDCASSGRPCPGGLRREAVVYLEYPRPCPDANSLQTAAVGLLLAANDKIDFSKPKQNAQPAACGNCGRFAENSLARS